MEFAKPTPGIFLCVLLPQAKCLAQKNMGPSIADSDGQQRRLHRALRLVERGRFADARDLLAEISTLRATNLMATMDLAEGNPDLAAEKLIAAHKQFPGDTATLMNLIVAHDQLQDSATTELFCRKLTKVKPPERQPLKIRMIWYRMREPSMDAASRRQELQDLNARHQNSLWVLDRLIKESVGQVDASELYSLMKSRSAIRMRDKIVPPSIFAGSVLKESQSGQKLARDGIRESSLAQIVSPEVFRHEFMTDSIFEKWLSHVLSSSGPLGGIKIRSEAGVGGSHASGITTSRAGAQINIDSASLRHNQSSFIQDAFWSTLVFEILNRVSDRQFAELDARAKRNDIDQSQYVELVARIEFDNLLRTHEIYLRLVLPSMNQERKSNALDLSAGVPSTFPDFFEKFGPNDFYPHRYYGRKYRLLQHRGYWPQSEKELASP